jgi:hypothetical protein
MRTDQTEAPDPWRLELGPNDRDDDEDDEEEDENEVEIGGEDEERGVVFD